jgi:hypothetical protein
MYIEVHIKILYVAHVLTIKLLFQSISRMIKIVGPYWSTRDKFCPVGNPRIE